MVSIINLWYFPLKVNRIICTKCLQWVTQLTTSNSRCLSQVVTNNILTCNDLTNFDSWILLQTYISYYILLLHKYNRAYSLIMNEDNFFRLLLLFTYITIYYLIMTFTQVKCFIMITIINGCCLATAHRMIYVLIFATSSIRCFKWSLSILRVCT